MQKTLFTKIVFQYKCKSIKVPFHRILLSFLGYGKFLEKDFVTKCLAYFRVEQVIIGDVLKCLLSNYCAHVVQKYTLKIIIVDYLPNKMIKLTLKSYYRLLSNADIVIKHSTNINVSFSILLTLKLSDIIFHNCTK